MHLALRQRMLLSQAGRIHAEGAEATDGIAADLAYREACRRIARARPSVAGRAPAADLLPLPEATLLHAGPPLDRPEDATPRLRRAILAAMRREALAGSDAEAGLLLRHGRVKLAPAQDFGVVTPLDVVVGPSLPLLRVADRSGAGCESFAPYLDDGGDGAVLAAAKCAVSAAGQILDCAVVTDFGSNGRDIGLKLSGAPDRWVSTAHLWLRRRHAVLRRIDDGVLGEGDGLVRHLLAGGAGAVRPLSAAADARPAGLRDIPPGLFAAGLARFTRQHWTVFVQPF